MAKTCYFVTGTDTGVGKTLVSAALLEAAKARGMRTLAIKPVASGCDMTPDGLRNEDALILQAAMTESLPYEQVNPVALAPAIAPHVAAAEAGRSLSAQRLVGFCRGLQTRPADLMLIEGAGGWRVPLNERETYAAVPRAPGHTGDFGGGTAPGLHQPRPADRRGHPGRRPDTGGLGGQPAGPGGHGQRAGDSELLAGASGGSVPWRPALAGKRCPGGSCRRPGSDGSV